MLALDEARRVKELQGRGPGRTDAVNDLVTVNNMEDLWKGRRASIEDKDWQVELCGILTVDVDTGTLLR